MSPYPSKTPSISTERPLIRQRRTLIGNKLVTPVRVPFIPIFPRNVNFFLSYEISRAKTNGCPGTDNLSAKQSLNQGIAIGISEPKKMIADDGANDVLLQSIKLKQSTNTSPPQKDY